MVNTPSKLKDRVVKRAVNNLRKDKRVESINLALIAEELDVTLQTLNNYYSSTEDIFLKAQKKDWDSLLSLHDALPIFGINVFKKLRPQVTIKMLSNRFLRDLWKHLVTMQI